MNGGDEMEIIYLILMFLGPGLVVKFLKEAEALTEHRPVRTGTIYEQSFIVVANSVLITAVAYFLIWCGHAIVGADFPLTLTGFIRSMDDMRMFASYIMVMLAVAFIFEKVAYRYVDPLRFARQNRKLKAKHGVEMSERRESTVWENIFLNPEINQKPIVASIYKDGQYITSGILSGWNAGMEDPNEFEIVRSLEVESVLKADKERSQKEKWLHDIDFEFFDCDSGVLIKCYDPKRILEHWDEIKL